MLKLVDEPTHNAASDAAAAPRRTAAARHQAPPSPRGRWILARRRDHSLDAYRQPRCFLYLQDIAEHGAALLSDIPLALGEHITLHLPAARPGQSATVPGHVVRCETTDPADAQPYQIAIRFDTHPAA